MSAVVTQADCEAATRIRDEMIGVARALADRSCGAYPSEMRAAQIEYLASELRHRSEAVEELVEVLGRARDFIDEEPALNDHRCPGANCAKCKRRLEMFSAVNSVLAKHRGEQG